MSIRKTEIVGKEQKINKVGYSDKSAATRARGKNVDNKSRSSNYYFKNPWKE